MAKHLKLQHSESVVLHCASRIYAAFISAGKVTDGEEDKWMKKSISDAIKLALTTDDAIVSDDEMESEGF